MRNIQTAKTLRRRKTTYHLQKTELIGLKAIQDTIEMVLWTLFIADERIVSLILGADPESGKTELMKKYAHNLGIREYLIA